MVDNEVVRPDPTMQTVKCSIGQKSPTVELSAADRLFTAHYWTASVLHRQDVYGIDHELHFVTGLKVHVLNRFGGKDG